MLWLRSDTLEYVCCGSWLTLLQTCGWKAEAPVRRVEDKGGDSSSRGSFWSHSCSKMGLAIRQRIKSSLRVPRVPMVSRLLSLFPKKDENSLHRNLAAEGRVSVAEWPKY